MVQGSQDSQGAPSDPSGVRPAARPGVLARALAWLRAGYPEGVPDHDYVALLGVLHRDLTEYEVERIAQQLVAEGHPQASPEQVRAAVRATACETASDADVARVTARLTAGGRPLEAPASSTEPLDQSPEPLEPPEPPEPPGPRAS